MSNVSYSGQNTTSIRYLACWGLNTMTDIQQITFQMYFHSRNISNYNKNFIKLFSKGYCWNKSLRYLYKLPGFNALIDVELYARVCFSSNQCSVFNFPHTLRAWVVSRVSVSTAIKGLADIHASNSYRSGEGDQNAMKEIKNSFHKEFMNS